MSGKKGDLEVTIVEARNIGNKGHPVYCSIELKTQRNTTSARTHYTNTSKDSKWNQTITLDLLSLDGEELLIQLYAKRGMKKKDKFLGQSQLTISALGLSKESEWHYLTDRPESERMANSNDSLKRSKSLTKIKRKAVYIISGEILFKLNFVHRLIRAKSKAVIGGSPLLGLQSSYSCNRLNLQPTVSHTFLEFKKKDVEPIANGADHPTPASEKRSASLGPPDLSSIEPNKPEDRDDSSSDEPPADLSVTEEVIIDEALKEKQKIVKEKLEQGERLVRTMTSRIIQMETTEGEAAVKEDKKKLEIIKREMSELERVLEWNGFSEEEPCGPFDRPKHTKSVKHIKSQSNDLKFSTLPRNYLAPRPYSKTLPEKPQAPPAPSARKWSDAPRPAQLPRTKSVQIAIPRQDSSESLLTPTSRSPLPSASPAASPSVSPSITPSPIISPSGSPSVPNISTSARPQSGSFSSTASSSTSRLPALPALPVVPPKPANLLPEVSEKFADSSEEAKFLRMKVKLLEKNVESLTTSNTVLVQEVARLERDLARYHKEEELRLREERLREREERFLAMEREAIQTRPKRSNSAPQPPNMDDTESVRSRASDVDTENYESDMDTYDEMTDAKYEVIVAKLEKLDKLDELLRKLDTMKFNANGVPTEGGEGRGYAELKAELESIEAIIMDETKKYTEKQKEDANIRYEKVSQEFQRTPEYRKEVAAALEEKRRVNEPLNKAALERMVKIYTPDAFRDNEEIKDKAMKNPELTLIGMDPKMILAKHQNDFQQYMLRNLSLDELRAIRASLPKFRGDQKRQIDWMETLEQKIDLVAKDPPKPPVKKAVAIKIKTKPAGCGGDFLSELRARQNAVAVGAGAS